MSASKSLASFTNFHFSRPPGIRRAFDAAERNGRFGRIQCQRSEEGSSRGKRKGRVILCRRTVRVKVINKVILASFLKIEGMGDARWSKRFKKEGQIEQLIGDQNPGFEAPPMSKKGRERREQRKCQGRSDCQRSDGEE